MLLTHHIVALLFIFMLMANSVFGQQSPSSPEVTEKQLSMKPPRDFRPTKLKLSVDAVPLFITAFSKVRDGYGFQATVDFDQYYLAFEMGGQRTERGESYQYNNEGNYWSVGPEINLLKNARNGNALTFGLRYGQAKFNDRLTFSEPGTFFGTIDTDATNPDLTARWMELTTSLSVHVTKGLYMGYTVRYKVLRSVKGIGVMAPYDVPGFGLYEDNTGVQFNYYIGWAIPLRNQYPTQLPEN